MKKIIITSLLIFTLALTTGCSSNSVSAEGKKLYNEQMEIYQKYSNFLKNTLALDEPGLSGFPPTAFFHLTDDEEKVWDESEFDKEMQGYLDKGAEIQKDADSLYNTFPNSYTDKGDADIFIETFNELKQKYKDFDFTLKTYE